MNRRHPRSTRTDTLCPSTTPFRSRGRVLPAEPTGETFETVFLPRISDLGSRHPVTAGLDGSGGPDNPPSWGRWFRQIEGDTNRGNVLMEGVGKHPLLILDRFGEGRVARIMSDHMWLWARGFEGGGDRKSTRLNSSH